MIGSKVIFNGSKPVSLDDSDLLAYNGKSELLSLSSSDDTHNYEYDENDLKCPSEERDNCKDAGTDRDKDSVVNMILNECMILLGSYYKTKDPKDADIRKNSEELIVSDGSIVCIDN